ncbi:MAG: glycosyltransferase [Bacteroidota bacterium]
MEPLVSVYITNHNYGAYIRQSIESVISQTFADYELLIIDDGSTDNSREIIEEYRELNNVKIIFQQNKGLNITNNIALSAAKGKYIMRLDADDYLDSNALLVMSNLLEKDNELGMVFPDYYLVDEQGNILNLEKRHDFTSEVKLMDQPAHGACTMIRREYLLQLNGYNEDYTCQDGYELWIKFINSYKVNNVNTALFYYRRHGANLTGNEDKILTTRAKIKEDFLSNSDANKATLAILPIRGVNSQNHTTAFEKVADKYLLDWKIDELLKTERVVGIVVTSPSEKVESYIAQHYNSEKIQFVKRDENLAQLNTNLSDTLSDVLSKVQNVPYEYLMVLGVEYPFISCKTINDAVNTLSIFKADSLVSVRPETSLFFKHDGEGMKPILNMDKFTKLERDALYKNIGGIMLATKEYFEDKSLLLGGKVSHIVIGQKESLGVFSKYDLKVANAVVDL